MPTDTQDEIVASVRAVLDGRHRCGEPLDDALWNAAVEQGWFVLGLDEQQGGAGFGVVEEMLVFTELGRACVPGPFLAGVIGTRVAAEAGDAALAERIASGEKVSLAQRDERGDALMVYDDGGPLWLVVDGDTVSLADAGDSEPFDSLDVLVSMARADAPGSTVATAANPEVIRRRGALLGAAMLAGMARGTAEQSVDYAVDREQFGQPIGGFQAVKHRCADMATRAEAAECQTRYAALAEAEGSADAAFHVHAARAIAARAAIDNAQVNVQNHGGIGFTWEHTAHRYVTRSRVVASQFGDTVAHLASLLAEPAPG